jgi:rare lipoprotein A
VRDEPAQRPPPARQQVAVAPPTSLPAPAPTRPGGYYQDDGPADVIPEGLIDTPDAEPKIEPYARGPSRPYQIFGQTYVPITDNRPLVQRGIGSWYGKKFHGQKTASGEIYDMFKMTAAHPTLPIPSYARVTNLRNGRQVIVRINDRGPFHASRIIDLSYTAALKLGYIRGGSAELEVERLLPEEIARLRSEKPRSTADMQTVLAQETDPLARVTAPSPTTAPAAGGGFFLQFGAYGKEPNAAAMRERLLAGWPAHLPPPAIVEANGLFRLHSGPFATRELATEAARQLKSAAQIQTTIVQR